MPTNDLSVDRRTVLGAVGATALATLAGCSGGDGGDGGASARQFGGWMTDANNYDGVTDATGQDRVTVDVGAEDSNGTAFAFAPAAIRVSAGTTVVWEWTGEGGQHNVVADGSFESELVEAAGHTFEQSLDESGTTEYYCLPHKGSGMKGVVVVE